MEEEGEGINRNEEEEGETRIRKEEEGGGREGITSTTKEIGVPDEIE